MAYPNTNHLVIEGRLATEPTIKEVGANGTLLAEFTIAVNLPSKPDVERSGFFICKAWKHTAKYLSDNGHKGDRIIIFDACLDQSQFEKDGKNVYNNYLTVNRLEVIKKKNNDASF